MKDSPRSSSRVNLSVLLIVLFVSTAVFEITLRVQYGHEHERIRRMYKRRDLCATRSPDARLVYTFKANVCGANSRGYRDYEYAVEKPDGTYRIVIIGDSVAEGKGVRIGESFGNVLQRMLNGASDSPLSSPSDGTTYEVIILARAGYSTSQQIVLLEEEAFDYSPDLILWSYVLNDPAHPLYHDANGLLGRYFFKPRIHMAHFVARSLFFMREQYRGRHCARPDEFHDFLHCVYWNQVETDIYHIAGVARDRDVPMVFLIHPIFEPVASAGPMPVVSTTRTRDFSEYSLAPLHRKLGALARDAGLLVLDMIDAFAGHDPNELRLQRTGEYDPWHPNETGHELIAEYLYERFDEMRGD